MVELPRLKMIREKRLLTQGELATKSDVSVVTIARLEGGKHRARFSTVRRLAAALDVAPELLIEPLPKQGELPMWGADVGRPTKNAIA